jgi:large subunit ribosomal protein L29
MKYAEIKEKSDIELDRQLADLRNRLQDMRFSIAAKQLRKVSEVHEVKTAIARILTEKRARQGKNV